MPATKKAGARANSVKKNPPEQFTELPKPESLNGHKSPYPEGVQTFSYMPKGGGEPILLALNGFESPDKVWLFDLAQLPPLAQTWRWMQRANVPKSIQRQAQLLPDTEYFEMFDQWFEAVQEYRGAGPKGAVTSGK